MDADQLASTTMDRRYRTLRRVQLHDAVRADTVFDLLMGNDVARARTPSSRAAASTATASTR